MILWQVVYQNRQFTPVDTECHELSIGTHRYMRYWATMDERLWPGSISHELENGDFLWKRLADSYEYELVKSGSGFDCNGHTVWLLVGRRLSDERLMFMLARRVGYVPHVRSQTYYVKASLIEALPYD